MVGGGGGLVVVLIGGEGTADPRPVLDEFSPCSFYAVAGRLVDVFRSEWYISPFFLSKKISFFGQGEFDVFSSIKVESVWLRCWSFLLVSVGHPSDERM